VQVLLLLVVVLVLMDQIQILEQSLQPMAVVVEQAKTALLVQADQVEVVHMLALLLEQQDLQDKDSQAVTEAQAQVH
jgi:hypothetical protein